MCLRQFSSIIVNFKDISGSWDMLFISPAYGILVDGVSKLPIIQSTIHYRSMLLLTTTILQCPSELPDELISLRSNKNVLILLWSRCNASLPAKGSVLTQMPQADAGAVRSSAGQNLHPWPWERGSKKGSENITIRPKGDKFGKQFEEHWKLFGAALRRRMRAREMDKTRAAMSHISGYGFGHLSGDA